MAPLCLRRKQGRLWSPCRKIEINPSDTKRAKSLNSQARKLKNDKIRERLYNAGIRFDIKSSDDDDDEYSKQERLKRRRRHKKNVEELIEQDDEEDTDDELASDRREFYKERLDHIRIFKDLETSGEYRTQHWHMKESPTGLDTDYLTCRFDPQLWDLDFYGDLTNTLPNTLQIYSLKLSSPDDCDYPLDVYGNLTLCTNEWFGPQVIFSRDSDDCQTLTKEDPYLTLTGPYCHPQAPPMDNVFIKADLRLKGTTESEEKYLSLSSAVCDEDYLAGRFNFTEYDVDIDPDDPYQRHVSGCCKEKPCECKSVEFGKHYLLEMKRSIVTYSVVANIYVQLVRREPRDGLLSWFFTAYTADKDESSCEEMKVVLLDCRDGKVPVLDNGAFVLSRQTICVHWFGTLMVYIEHGMTGKVLIFKPELDGEDIVNVDIGSSTIEIKVEWSVYWEKYRRLFK